MKRHARGLLLLTIGLAMGGAYAQPPGYPGFPGFPGYQRPAPGWVSRHHHGGVRLERDSTPEGYLLKIYPTGDLDPQAIQISVQGRSLRIEVDQSMQQEENDRDRGYFSFSRSSSHFLRRLTLPRDADTEHMKRSVKDGVINLLLPRRGG